MTKSVFFSFHYQLVGNRINGLADHDDRTDRTDRLGANLFADVGLGNGRTVAE